MNKFMNTDIGKDIDIVINPPPLSPSCYSSPCDFGAQQPVLAILGSRGRAACFAGAREPCGYGGGVTAVSCADSRLRGYLSAWELARHLAAENSTCLRSSDAFLLSLLLRFL